MTVLLFLAVLVGLIVVHEFGHFIVAKLSGIRVDEFGIFFGPTLFKKKIGETDYTINTIPFGGFVRIFGEDPSEVSGSPDQARALTSKSKWTQAAVLVAGVLFNVLAAWFLFAWAFTLGVPTSVAADDIRSVQNPVLTIAAVLPNSPADNADLHAGDVILGLSSGGDTLTELTPESAAAFISTHESDEFILSYKRGAEEKEALLSTQTGVLEDESSRAAIGISMGLVGTLKMPFHTALYESLIHTGRMLGLVTVGILSFLGSALTLSADFSQVAGPVGIVSLVGDAASLGFVTLITFTAFISLHLAVINLLPIPALDGGRLLFVGIEAVKGSAIKPKVAQTMNIVGFVLLILLMLIVTFNDIVRIVT